MEERFWAKVQKSESCWVWKAGTSQKGYGWFRVDNNEMSFAHRVSYGLTHGEIPEGMFVCHSCGNPACVRPSHLFLCDTSTNVLDKVEEEQSGKWIE